MLMSQLAAGYSRVPALNVVLMTLLTVTFRAYESLYRNRFGNLIEGGIRLCEPRKSSKRT